MERDGNNGIDGLVSGLILIRECGINTLENVMDGEFRFYDRSNDIYNPAYLWDSTIP